MSPPLIFVLYYAFLINIVKKRVIELKKIILPIIFVFLLLAVYFSSSGELTSSGESLDMNMTLRTAEEFESVQMVAKEEIRGIWVSYLELTDILTGKSEEDFRSLFTAVVENAKSLSLNSIFVHVRPFNDAVYHSEIFPTSYLVTGTAGDILPFDPLAIMIEVCKEKNMQIHAWINPYRVMLSNDRELTNDNIVYEWYNSGSINILDTDSGIYLNPLSLEVTDLIVSGVLELINNYTLDGVHFDDYFYPQADFSVDEEYYQYYLSEGGSYDIETLRLDRISYMVREVYRSIKEFDANILFGISPQGNIDNNYNMQYADVKLWISEEGYIDYICPQIYYGFENETAPFTETLKSWISKKSAETSIYVGITFHKINEVDTFAGSGEYEWISNEDIVSRMVETSIENEVDGIVFYGYDYIFNPSEDIAEIVNSELEKIKIII